MRIPTAKDYAIVVEKEHLDNSQGKVCADQPFIGMDGYSCEVWVCAHL